MAIVRALLLLPILALTPLLAAEPQLPAPLSKTPQPNGRPSKAATIALGKKLFFDPRLSRESRISCATCHQPDKGFSNGQRLAQGVDGKNGKRHVPAIVNVAWGKQFFWDGRAGSLEAQALGPIQDRLEMDMQLPKLVAKLRSTDDYPALFDKAFGARISPQYIAKALAAYERTIVSRDTPFDRYLAGEKKALPPAALRGLKLFYGQAGCVKCHSGSNLTDNKYHNIGSNASADSDPGRFAVTKKKGDTGAFKTPTLREVAHTAPYMHNGRFKTLTDVVKHYNFGGVRNYNNPHRDEFLEVLYLSEKQVADLVAFLKQGVSMP